MQKLGDDYRAFEQHNYAKECNEKSLIIRKKNGQEHPDVATS